MFFAVGDTPAAPVDVLPTRDGEPVDLDLYETAAAVLTFPDGSTVAAAATLPPEDDEDDEDPAVSITLPTLTVAGIVFVTIRLTAAGGKLDTFEVPPLVVQPLDGWHTIQSAHEEWAGSRELDDGRLFVLLSTAKTACVRYKPEAGTRRPTVDEREAQLTQARNRHRAGNLNPDGGDEGSAGYGATVFPMDWMVKALLRPPSRTRGIR